MVRNDRIREIARPSTIPLRACKMLTDRALSPGGHDNIPPSSSPVQGATISLSRRARTSTASKIYTKYFQHLRPAHWRCRRSRANHHKVKGLERSEGRRGPRQALTGQPGIRSVGRQDKGTTIARRLTPSRATPTIRSRSPTEGAPQWLVILVDDHCWLPSPASSPATTSSAGSHRGEPRRARSLRSAGWTRSFAPSRPAAQSRSARQRAGAPARGETHRSAPAPPRSDLQRLPLRGALAAAFAQP
jgi:hypothetical protein